MVLVFCGDVSTAVVIDNTNIVLMYDMRKPFALFIVNKYDYFAGPHIA